MRFRAGRSFVFKLIFSLFCAAGVHALLANEVQAGSYYWDSNGTAAGGGLTPSGTWGVSGFWTLNSAGTTSTFAYTTSASDDLYFVVAPSTSSGENAFTITVSGTQSANGLHFTSSGAPTLSGTGTVLLGGDGVSVAQYAFGTTAQGAVTITSPMELLAGQS